MSSAVAGDRFDGLHPQLARTTMVGDSEAATASLWSAVPTSALTRHGSSTDAPARSGRGSASSSRSAGTISRPSIHACRPAR